MFFCSKVESRSFNYNEYKEDFLAECERIEFFFFPLVVALVAFAVAFALGATAFIDAAAAEVLVGFKAMRTFSFLEVDRYEILGITKTHVKSKEMTGSCFDYATKFLVFGTTEPIGSTSV